MGLSDTIFRRLQKEARLVHKNGAIVSRFCFDYQGHIVFARIYMALIPDKILVLYIILTFNNHPNE